MGWRGCSFAPIDAWVYAITSCHIRVGHGNPLFKWAPFAKIHLKWTHSIFGVSKKNRIYSQKTGFETRVFGNTRLLGDLRQKTPVNWAKMIPNGTF